MDEAQRALVGKAGAGSLPECSRVPRRRFRCRERGLARKRGNKFVAVNRGRVVRELTEAEYRTSHGFAIGFFPSFWMVFSGYPLMIAIAKRKASSNDPFPVRQGFLWDRRS